MGGYAIYGPWGRAREELLSATLLGTAGRRPNRECGSWAAAEAARHNVTKPHRLRTLRDAGREREQVPSRSKHLKAPLVVDSEGVAGLKWSGAAVRYWSRSHGRRPAGNFHL